jgi:transcription elongation factor GreA-like protein
MNALDNIQNEAGVIVDQLADRQIADMKRLDDAFQEWLAVDGNAIALRLVDQVDLYNSTYKYIYMTHFRIYNRETCIHERPTTYNNTYEERSAMGYSKDLMHMVHDLRTMTSSNWEVKYRELFVAANMVKLNRALGKHINNEMDAKDINVTTGGDGAEVTATINGMFKFKTFGTLCGGDVQCYHYRYRSSLKSIKR